MFAQTLRRTQFRPFFHQYFFPLFLTFLVSFTPTILSQFTSAPPSVVAADTHTVSLSSLHQCTSQITGFQHIVDVGSRDQSMLTPVVETLHSTLRVSAVYLSVCSLLYFVLEYRRFIALLSFKRG